MVHLEASAPAVAARPQATQSSGRAQERLEVGTNAVAAPVCNLRAGALHRIGKRSSTLLQELGREPTVEEIAEELELSHEELQAIGGIAQTA